jgi:hypothetical protein
MMPTTRRPAGGDDVRLNIPNTTPRPAMTERPMRAQSAPLRRNTANKIHRAPNTSRKKIR